MPSPCRFIFSVCRQMHFRMLERSSEWKKKKRKCLKNNQFQAPKSFEWHGAETVRD